jgi:hypothetical protein
VIKWDGRGLRLPLQTISFLQEGTVISKIIFEGIPLFVRRLDLRQPDYAVSICSQKEYLIEELQEVDENFLINY